MSKLAGYALLGTAAYFLGRKILSRPSPVSAAPSDTIPEPGYILTPRWEEMKEYLLEHESPLGIKFYLAPEEEVYETDPIKPWEIPHGLWEYMYPGVPRPIAPSAA